MKELSEAPVAEVEMSGCHGNHRGDEQEEIGEEVEGEKGSEEERLAKLKQRLVSQVLEIGIVFHSVIIGVTMGMSQNQCAIRPLVVALSFHQIFEGMGLGGCIAQVNKKKSLFCFAFVLKNQNFVVPLQLMPSNC